MRPGWEILGGLLSALGSSCSALGTERVLERIRAAIPAYGAMDPSALDQSGGVLLPASTERGTTHPVAALGDTARTGTRTATHPVLRREGAFDWGEDPLVTGSPTLRRGPASRRRLSPRGLVAMSPQDATSLGVRQGWTVRLKSAHGEVEAAVSLQPGLEPGVLLAPYAFREQLAGVLGGGGVTEVEVAKT